MYRSCKIAPLLTNEARQSIRVLHTAHCTLHTAHCTLHTAHCTLHTAHCGQHQHPVDPAQAFLASPATPFGPAIDNTTDDDDRINNATFSEFFTGPSLRRGYCNDPPLTTTPNNHHQGLFSYIASVLESLEFPSPPALFCVFAERALC